ncbi:putative disease resistance protein RGA3 isoform X2 [Coffea arabica]
MLLDESNHKFVSVIPITGEEGLGKTNLVKSIYNHQRMGKFGVKLWVCVSKRVSIEELFKLILLQLTVEKVDRENRNGIVGKIGKQRRGKRFGEDDRNAIVQQIGSQLQGERYFLVLDDVWDDNPKLWDDLFITLERINQTIGSWCLVTTRSDSVARSVSVALRREHEVYALRKLHDEDCWYILLKKAFGEKEAPDELEKIKERILQRCDGLPATACLIGLQLRNLDLNKKEESGSILDKLLSLDNLSSPSIKKCFAYCSMFPKDTKIERDMLIELWMAEGFLPTCPNNQTMMEETGMNHLRILWESWLLEEIRHDFWEVYYKMQDVAHKHAKSMSKSTKVISDRETGNVHNGDLVRYLAVDSLGEDREELFKSLKTSLLHTLFVRSSSSSGDVLMKLKNLYVLNLSGVRNQKLPKSIGKLIHLRFIDFSDSGSGTLPQSVCKLYNLQTLRLNSGTLKALPKEMSNLISMRHLHYQNPDDKFEMPLKMGRLTCLQTLEFFNVGRKKGRRIGELGFLKNLKGKLVIRNLQLVKDKEGAEEAKLSEKANLFRLYLEWALDREGDDYNDVDVLDGLPPHPNLEELKIQGFMGDQFPQWSMDLPTTLPKLVSLGFENCNRCTELPPLQNLTSLKELTIHKCGGLTSLRGDMLQSCTSLQKLRVIECHNLTSFQPDLQHTPSLLEVELRGCPNLEELKIRGFMGDQFPQWSMDLPTTLPKLVSLGFDNCNRCRQLPPLQNLTSLKELTIHKCGGLTNLPADMLQSCSSLQKLRVTECHNLTSFQLDLRHTPSLLEMELWGCPNLKTSTTPRGFGFLTGLRTLSIGPFSDDDEEENSLVYNKFDWSGLTSSSSSSSSSTLEVLKLRGLPHMKTLPGQLRDLTTLKSLALHDFGEVETLPDAISCLANLTYLSIDGSPLLKERFTSQSSSPDEWSKVPPRIQNISIDGQPLVRQ